MRREQEIRDEKRVEDKGGDGVRRDQATKSGPGRARRD